MEPDSPFDDAAEDAMRSGAPLAVRMRRTSPTSIAALGEEGYEGLRHGLDMIVEILKEEVPSD